MNQISAIKTIREKIYHVRGLQVMLDSELSEIYGIETKAFNQAVKRNEARFPESFRFQLTVDEYKSLRSQIVTLKDLSRGQHRKYMPYVFTEQGVAMLSSVLRSKTAIEVSVQIMQSFVEMRKFFATHGDLVMKIQHIEQKQVLHEAKTQEKFEALFSALEEKPIVANQGIFFDGQVFDAYVFVSKLIRSAKKSIILIDNYIDETVLELLTKAGKVNIFILTKNITKNLELDIKKYNEQYQDIKLCKFGLSHDRFLIIDQNELYHIGASLKDLGKKWFAFSKFDQTSFALMNQVEKVINT
jgi:phage regulator Rha-like protein